MTSTRIVSYEHVIPNRVSGYQLSEGQLQNDIWLAPAWCTTTDGVLYANVFDMETWDAALYTDKLIKRSSLEGRWSPVKLNDDTTYPSGFAWCIRDVNGHRLIQQDGVGPSFTTRVARYVNDLISIVVFMNVSEDEEVAMPTRMADARAAIHIPSL